MKKLVLYSAIAFFISTVQAQNNRYNEAVLSFEKADYEAAYDLFEESGLYFQTENEFTAYSQCNIYMGLCLNRLSAFENSVQLIKATEKYIMSQLEGNPYLLAECKRIKGEALLNLGKNSDALEVLLEAEKMYPDTAKIELSECYNNIGITYWNNGNREKAEQYHNQALTIRKELFGAESLPVADTYNNLGLLYVNENGLDASIYFNRALNIYESTYGDLHPKVAYGLVNLARAKSQQGIYTQALEHLDKVDQIWNSLYKEENPAKAFTLNTRGQILYSKKEYRKALAIHLEALKVYLKLFGEKHPEVANTHFLIGSCYQQMGEFKKAIEKYQEAIYSNVPGASYSSIYDLPPLDNYDNGDYLLSHLMAKAKALEALYREKSLTTRHLKSAIATYQKSDTLVDQLRRIRVSEQDKIKLGETSKLIYGNAIDLTTFLYDQPILGRSYHDDLYNFFERSKSAVLLSAIQETKAKEFAGIPNELLQEEDSLLDQITTLKQKQAKGDNSQEVRDRLFKYTNAYQVFIDELEEFYPEYFRLKYQADLTSLTVIQKVLSPDEELWMYFIQDNQVKMIQINDKNVKFTSRESEQDLLKLIAAARNSLKYQVKKMIDSTSVQLYDILVPDKLDHKDIVIFADENLGTLPFEVLKNKETNRYLIEDASISYDLSVTLHQARTREQSSSDATNALLIAPVSFQEEFGISDLPGTRKEVDELSRLMRINNINAEKMLLTASTEEGLVLQKPYKFIHFATHGFVDPEHPELSRIYLKPGENSDGILYAGEIYNNKLTCDLVTLSACETGLGQVASGEGIIGLSRAFTYAGAKNQMVSYWQVSDASTAELMISFYTYYLGQGNREFKHALRAAKLDMIASKKYNNPYYWAPFILIGK